MFKPMFTAMLFALAYGSAAADPGAASCASDPKAAGLTTRIEKMHDQVARAQMASDPAEQRRVMSLHAKLVHEGLRELRRLDPELQSGCRLELMQSLMEQMVAHQSAAHDFEER
jgi:hypothetical protein